MPSVRMPASSLSLSPAAGALAAVALAAVALAACGGGTSGGGGTTPPTGLTNAIFSGVYSSTILGGTNGPPGIAFGAATSVNANGASALTIGGQVGDVQNLDGAIAVVAAGVDTYAVAADGSMTWPNRAFTGGITTAGDVFVGSDLKPLDAPGLFLGVRRGAGFSTGTLSGDYHFDLLSCSGPGGPRRATWGSLTFSGTGAITAGSITLARQNTVLFAPSALPVGTYTVATDGTSTITNTAVGGLGAFTGGVLAGGNFAIFGGDTRIASLPGTLVLIRKSLTAAAATFAGNYWLAGLKFESATFTWNGFFGTAVANGLGGVGGLNYASTIENAEGVISPNAGPTDYTVLADGRLNTDTVNRQGAVSSDGRFAFLSGEVNGGLGTTPILFVFVRK